MTATSTTPGVELKRSDAGWVLVGSLTVRDRTQPCELAVDTLTSQDEVLVASATATIDRYAFGITTAKGMVARRLHVQVRVTARRA